MDKDILLCSCGSVEHQVLFCFDRKYQGDNIIYMYVHLTKKRGFFKRLWHGIKYAFGYQCRYGAFEEVVIDKENYQSLKKVVEYIEKN